LINSIQNIVDQQGKANESVPEFDIHFAVGAEEAGLEKPNCKTSVALGALKLVRGSALLKKDRLYARSQGEAPFKYFVGTLRRGELRHVLEPDSAYHEWHDLGIIREGVFLLCWSASPRARNGMEEGDIELRTMDVPLAVSV
jgi:hypothetical protein